MKRKLTAATLVLTMAPLVVFPARAEEGPKTLYERLGGLRNITPVVEDFVDRLYANPTLNENPALYASHRSTPPSYLKFQFAQLVCEMSGGPCVYSGLTMKEAHEPFRIDADEWGIMAAELKKSLQKFNVPATEQAELLELFEETKDDIVENPEVAASK